MKHLKTILAFVLVLVAVITLTGCSTKPLIPNNSVPQTEATPEIQTPDDCTPAITIPERLLNKFEKINNEVTYEEYLKEYYLGLEAFLIKCENNITVEEANNIRIENYNASEGQLVKGNFIDTWNYIGIRKYDMRKQVALYDAQSHMTEEMNIKGCLGKAEEVYTFKGGSLIKNNIFYNFDSINEVKAKYMLNSQFSLYNTNQYNTSQNNDISNKYYVDNNGSLLTIISYDNLINITSMSQLIIDDNKVTEINYSCFEGFRRGYIKSIGAYFDCNCYILNVKTTSYMDGYLTVPNIDSYEFGSVTTPQFWG